MNCLLYTSPLAKGHFHGKPLGDDLLQNFQLHLPHQLDVDLPQLFIPHQMELGVLFFLSLIHIWFL